MANTIQGLLASKSGDQSVQYISTVDAYNKWAEVYDTDGNFLQTLDTLQMRQILPMFLALAAARTQQEQAQPIKLVDLGCGTGRNTLQLVAHAPRPAHIIGLDASPGMLNVARSVIRHALPSEEDGNSDLLQSCTVDFEVLDLLQTPLTPPPSSLHAAGVISTLVLEHIPARTFFEGAAALLRPGGFLLVTNMHAEMGSISQAGFVDPETGTKIRPTSYRYTVQDVLQVAEECGFQLERLGGQTVREVEVDAGLAEVLGKRAQKWIGVKVWFGGCFSRKQ
ncbi:hypothetical protein ASPZODRAFT_59176 [Penicilliopsis zonata CBS 506.65]|uniref:Methyltransferase domain-containing protein n=1 Tax=Penicilliopsis zonata CBS 506.65 TaxID=1073090 RepID=A0A1L9SRV2_9EURO|nr:hypothetical protein ASPZODRAFT_59176 [Penicilliopsis zonata CBS 506.65]OJJ49932.1 hypothetical protein ASPZODRAFT_59176 [Penicilliopsis zonata CBS 506.65]